MPAIFIDFYIGIIRKIDISILMLSISYYSQDLKITWFVRLNRIGKPEKWFFCQKINDVDLLEQYVPEFFIWNLYAF